MICNDKAGNILLFIFLSIKIIIIGRIKVGESVEKIDSPTDILSRKHGMATVSGFKYLHRFFNAKHPSNYSSVVTCL